MAEQQQRLQALTEEYQKLQTDLQTSISSRQKLESQQQENKSVQKEFSALSSDSNIYKLVGPVLLKQDKTEAVMAVDGRLEFIEKEIKRVEQAIKDVQDKSDGLKMEIIKLQSETQGAQPQAAA
ncbi:Bcyke2 [Botrytis cinerea B05.10]|uniref:Bcyke2 n=4 Tax=Botrytis TaxID=33196 RepID=A0A384JAB8_BOTFB|nr:Bcyke2 [Botrytis cinerea B05.10]ATZ47585.1 Bcyke2 [Botrytis cinerea B05.10]EMR86701.1 putative prefoldin subunit 6 protein [Botrytis cinerea BcDW1]CCD43376.1 similar to prefoldin subunit 6 [Botrytis cinerea T4]